MLYELSVGQKAFQGDTPVLVIADVLRQEPRPIKEIRVDVPSELTRVITRCLRKDPRKRLRDIGDAMELVEDATAPTAPSRSRFSAKGWIAAAVLFVVAGVALPFALAHLREKPAVAEPVRFHAQWERDASLRCAPGISRRSPTTTSTAGSAAEVRS